MANRGDTKRVRQSAVEMLEALDPKAVSTWREALLAMFHNPNRDVRLAAVKALVALPPEELALCYDDLVAIQHEYRLLASQHNARRGTTTID